MQSKLKKAMVCAVVGVSLFGTHLTQATAPAPIPPEEPPTPVIPAIPSVMARIAFCESGNKQFLPNGKIVRGPDGHDIGRFQIRETVHLADAKRLGLDIYTEVGNTAYALLLYKRNGTRDWRSSERCWGG